jgi:predicted PhzF superfamily epimerase YddE/YHI9
MTARDLTTLQLVWWETAELFHARDPFPVGGVTEDPATGAAAAAFGAYLRALGDHAHLLVHDPPGRGPRPAGHAAGRGHR